MMQPLGRNRWTFFHDRDGGDRLVHSALAAHGTSFEHVDVNVYPYEAITECGVWIQLYPGAKGQTRQGVYVNDEHMLTCIRCLSGRANDGVSFRQEQKVSKFAQMYGMKTRNVLSGRYPSVPKIPLQNLPPPRSYGASHIVYDEAGLFLRYAQLEALYNKT